jgi:hypothetical protein
MFLCIWNCCSNVECNSNEEGRNGRNIWNVCYSFNIYIYIYIYNKNYKFIFRTHRPHEGYIATSYVTIVNVIIKLVERHKQTSIDIKRQQWGKERGGGRKYIYIFT